jgi:hypothetical protein
MVNPTIKEVTNAMDGESTDQFAGMVWNQLIQVVKGTHPIEAIQSSSIEPTVKTINAATYTLTSADGTILADATSSSITLTLPTAGSNIKKHFTIKKVDSALANLVRIVTTSSQTIDGLASWILSQRGERVQLESDGANWQVVDFLSPRISLYQTRGTVLNRWYTTPTNGTALTTASVVANTLYALPYLVSKPMTFTKMAINVTTGGANSTARVGIYADDGNCSLGALIAGSDVGTYPTATSSKVVIGTLPSAIILQPGLYWLAFNCSTTAPVVRGFPIAGLTAILGLDSGLGTAPGLGWAGSYTYGPMPSSPTGFGVITAAPLPAVFLLTTG